MSQPLCFVDLIVSRLLLAHQPPSPPSLLVETFQPGTRPARTGSCLLVQRFMLAALAGISHFQRTWVHVAPHHPAVQVVAMDSLLVQVVVMDSPPVQYHRSLM